ncbi:MAG: DsrE family protein [Deltaproteobacteria bacterium]|nr:DsrE family protein [Deltaproteobacteria bacterium]
MKLIRKLAICHFSIFLFTTMFLALINSSAVSAEYNALKGVDKIKAVFDVSMGSPQKANLVFWAVRNVYDDKSVRALPESPEVAVVFHGPAVKMISSNRDGVSEKDKKALDEFAGLVTKMKQDGVKMEVCLYAAKVLGVDPGSILPEIDHVGNGFISVAGYQSQGYSVVAIP